MNQPGQDLIQLLEELRVELNQAGVERTAGLLRAMGDDCSYYRKSLNIFLDKHYDKVKNLVTKAGQMINNIK